MGAPPIKTEKLSPTLHLSEYKNGFWLWDETRKMNLAMRAETERAAFLEALDYYQERLMQVEAEYKALSAAVDLFVEQVRPEDQNEQY